VPLAPIPDRGDLLGQVLDPRTAGSALIGIPLVEALKVILELGVSGFDQLGQGRPGEIAVLVVDRFDPRAVHRQQLPAKQVQLTTEQHKLTKDLAERGGVDAVIVDTAGRLHTKTGLMDELGKIKRVIERQATVDEVLLVLDATTGQNGLRQARVFAEAVDVTGIVLTKLDGTAKGGIVVAVQRELGVPVKLVGLGEGLDDLAPFEPAPFVDAILG